jgi:hypothetical protein
MRKRVIKGYLTEYGVDQLTGRNNMFMDAQSSDDRMDPLSVFLWREKWGCEAKVTITIEPLKVKP